MSPRLSRPIFFTFNPDFFVFFFLFPCAKRHFGILAKNEISERGLIA